MEGINSFKLKSDIDRICGVGPLPNFTSEPKSEYRDFSRLRYHGHQIRGIKKRH